MQKLIKSKNEKIPKTQPQKGKAVKNKQNKAKPAKAPKEKGKKKKEKVYYLKIKEFLS
ncbi:hypothetical protein [Lacrimispora celerecrescens]|uniref:hypothetical protein n=1 Tax=Lacrimispora celerecrescens TaxID=29354 RepID=UPI000AF7C484|nr:hypothetical protein [Lacrimispora celerecrescens]